MAGRLLLPGDAPRPAAVGDIAAPRRPPPASSARRGTPSPSNGRRDCSGWRTSSWMVMLSPKSLSPSRSVRKLRPSSMAVRAEVAEHLANQVEHRRRFEDHRVARRVAARAGSADPAAFCEARRASAGDVEHRADPRRTALAQPELSAAMAVMRKRGHRLLDARRKTPRRLSSAASADVGGEECRRPSARASFDAASPRPRACGALARRAGRGGLRRTRRPSSTGRARQAAAAGHRAPATRIIAIASRPRRGSNRASRRLVVARAVRRRSAAAPRSLCCVSATF